MAKAVVLLSGGLDSTLAAWLIREQRIGINGLTFATVFAPGAGAGTDKPSSAAAAARFLGIALKVVENTHRLLAIVKAPKHGHGSNLNPCIDCRIDELQQARAYLGEIGGDFLVTGEVLGQRPMSQRRDAMNLIDKEAGVKGLVVRPLSGRLLPPTIPEQKGLIDRGKLLDIAGRSRHRQMALAQQIGLTDYPSPAGGCVLTDPNFSLRLADLLAHCDATPADVELLKVGRHFRLDDATKAVVGRCDADNQRLLALAQPGDVLFEVMGIPGPTTLLRGRASDDNVALAAALTARFSKASTREVAEVRVMPFGGPPTMINVSPQRARDVRMLGA